MKYLHVVVFCFFTFFFSKTKNQKQMKQVQIDKCNCNVSNNYGCKVLRVSLCDRLHRVTSCFAACAFHAFVSFFFIVVLNCFNAKFECGCDFCFLKNICEHNAEQICKLINAN